MHKREATDVACPVAVRVEMLIYSLSILRQILKEVRWRAKVEQICGVRRGTSHVDHIFGRFDLEAEYLACPRAIHNQRSEDILVRCRIGC